MNTRKRERKGGVGAGWRQTGRGAAGRGERQEGSSAVVEEFTHLIFFHYHNTFARCSPVTQMREARLGVPVLNT